MENIKNIKAIFLLPASASSETKHGVSRENINQYWPSTSPNGYPDASAEFDFNYRKDIATVGFF